MTDSELNSLIDVGTAQLGIPVLSEWRDGIRLHLAISLRLADLVAAFELPDDIDTAPVFRA